MHGEPRVLLEAGVGVERRSGGSVAPLLKVERECPPRVPCFGDRGINLLSFLPITLVRCRVPNGRRAGACPRSVGGARPPQKTTGWSSSRAPVCAGRRCGARRSPPRWSSRRSSSPSPRSATRAPDPGGHSILTAASSCCATAVARVQFEVGAGAACPRSSCSSRCCSSPRRPGCRCWWRVGDALSRVPDTCAATGTPTGSTLHVVSAWYAIGPVVVLGPRASRRRPAAHLAVVAAALGAQFAIDVGTWVALGLSPRASPVGSRSRPGGWTSR